MHAIINPFSFFLTERTTFAGWARRAELALSILDLVQELEAGLWIRSDLMRIRIQLPMRIRIQFQIQCFDDQKKNTAGNFLNINFFDQYLQFTYL
jgi:hypothetical protein